MKAMLFEGVDKPLRLFEAEDPEPGPGQLLIEVEACAVCRTDLHIIAGELIPPSLPRILGHQIVGRLASKCQQYPLGKRMGVPWLGKSCGVCPYCQDGRENLCDDPIFTGFTIDGGFAEKCVAYEDFVFPLPEETPPEKLTPYLCSGLIGYRTLRFLGDAQAIGFYGYGSSAHLLIQVAIAQNKQVYVFTRPGDTKGQEEALADGATWAGDSDTLPPALLDGAILFAPVGELVPLALRAVCKGGSVVSAGIHMSDIPTFPYEILWGERVVRSVANLTRQDGEDFLKLAPQIPVETRITCYPLEEANQAIKDVQKGKITGTAVLTLS